MFRFAGRRLLYRSYTKASCQPGTLCRRLTTKFGDEFEADFSSFLEWQLWAFGAYEEQFAALFRCLIQPGDRCIDVGANIGVHTVRLAKLAGPRGEVIAIEPDEGLAQRASNNFMLNRLENVRLIRAAASERSGDSVLLYRPDIRDSNKGRASLLQHSYLTGPAVRVPAVSIDDVNEDPVALIKIDVEGHEAAVVSGASRTIEAFSPAIIFEYAPELILGKSSAPFEWFRQKGHELFSIGQGRNGITGRGRLELERLRTLPRRAMNILAISPEMAPRIGSLVR